MLRFSDYLDAKFDSDLLEDGEAGASSASAAATASAGSAGDATSTSSTGLEGSHGTTTADIATVDNRLALVRRKVRKIKRKPIAESVTYNYCNKPILRPSDK